MPHTRLLVALAGVGAVACAGAAAPGTPGGPPLRYERTESLTAAYAFSDTTEFAIETGRMGVMTVRSGQSGVAEVQLSRAPSGAEGIVRVPSYSGRFENPGQGVTTADETDIGGAWRVHVDPTGRLDITEEPTLTARAREVGGSGSLIRPLFAHLPATPAAPGDSWVDTVWVTDEGAETTTRIWSVVTSTLVGDTAVAGDALLLIRTSSLKQVEVEGASGGVEIRQRLSGTLEGTVLWDGARSIMAARSESGELTGTLELPGMGLEGMPVTATVRQSVSRLR